MQATVVRRAEEMRRSLHGANFTTPPGPGESAVRLVLLGEICGAAGFGRDRLYLEYALRYDPAVWRDPVSATKKGVASRSYVRGHGSRSSGWGRIKLDVSELTLTLPNRGPRRRRLSAAQHDAPPAAQPDAPHDPAAFITHQPWYTTSSLFLCSPRSPPLPAVSPAWCLA